MIFGGVLSGGDDGIRTHDPLLAGQVLSQLSYTPVLGVEGLGDRSRMRNPRSRPEVRNNRSPPKRRRTLSYSERTKPESFLLKSSALFPTGPLAGSRAGVGADLSSRAVAGKVFSALRSLTSVFGMGTGGPSGMRYRLSETTVPEN